MRQKVSNYDTKEHLILYKGHTGWKVKTRLFGTLMVTLSALTLMESAAVLQAKADTTNSTPTVETTSQTAGSSAATSTETKSVQSASSAAGSSASSASQAATSADSSKQQSSAASTSNASAAPSATSQASSSAATSTAKSAATSAETSAASSEAGSADSTTSKPLSRASLVKMASVEAVSADTTSTTDTTSSTDSTATTTTTYPVLKDNVSIGADSTEVNLTADQIADHFTATVENRDGGDADANTAKNITTTTIGSDGSVSLTSNSSHTVYDANGNASTVTGHQAAHVSFEHEIDFSHNFSMTGAIGIGSKSSGGADSVGFIFAPGDPSKATEGGSGGLLGLGGLDNAFGFVYDEYYNSNYNDPSSSPYIGWRTTDSSGNLQAVSSKNEWGKASTVGLTRSSSPVNTFTMDYDATSKMLTVVLGSSTFTRVISDTSTGYSVSVSASTGGSWNDYSAKIESFSYTPKTTDISVNLVDATDDDALLKNTDVTAIANIGDTISVFSTQAAANRAVAAGLVDASLVSVLPTDSAGNVYVIDSSQAATSGHGEAHTITGEDGVADATYYTYTVTDGTTQSMIVPVKLAFTATVTAVDSSGKAIAGIDPITVTTVAGEQAVVQFPGYTATKVVLNAPTTGQAVANDTVTINQGNTATDNNTTTTDTSDPLAHYYTNTGTTVDGQKVTTTGSAGTGQSITKNLNGDSYVDANGNAVTSGGETVSNTTYYWSEVGNASATDSTDESSPQTTKSVLVPTKSTLDYWITQATANQTQADDYSTQATDLYNSFIKIEGLTQAQIDAATKTFNTIKDTYQSVSDSNAAAKADFEKGEVDGTADADIYQAGQDGYAALQKAQDLLVGFKADLDDLSTTNKDAQDVLATLDTTTAVYGQDLPLPNVEFGSGFGTLTAAQIAGMQQAGYFVYYSGSDSTTSVTPKNVGTYIVKMTDAGRAYLKTLNADAGLFVASTLTITPADVAPTVNATTATYGGTNSDGTALTLSGKLGTAAADHTLASTDFEIIDNTTGKVVTAKQLQAGGDYTIQYTAAAQDALTKDTNYTFTSFGTAKLTVVPKAITVTANNHAKTYGTTDDPTLDLANSSTNGLVNGDSLDDLGVKLVRASGETAGTYAISIDPTATLNSNYTVSLDTSANEGVFTIAPRAITVQISDIQKTYGDADPTNNITLATGSSSLVGSDTLAGLGMTYTRDTGENVETYTITGSGHNANYSVTVNSGTLTINPREVTVKAADTGKTYGTATDPTLTLVDPSSVLVNGDKEADLDVTLSRATGENAGDYDITGSSSSKNYTVTVEKGTFTIKKLAVTVTAANKKITYGDADETLTLVDPSGVLVKGDDESALGVTLSRTGDKNAGSYVISGTGADNTNYDVTVVDGAYTIDKKAVTVVAADTGKIYGDTDPALSLKDPTSVLVTGDDESDLGVTLSRVTGENVADYAITGTSNSANYNVTVTDGKFTISKRNVTVIAADNGKTYGEADPTLALEDPTSVLVNGDKEEALAVTLSRVTGEDVNTYAITGKSTSANYNVTVTPGTFKISQRAITVTADSYTKTYGSADPELNWKLTAGSLADSDTLASLKISTSRDTGNDAGDYTINASANNANYDITFVAGKLTINPLAVTVKASDITSTYGDAEKTLTLDDPSAVLANGDKEADLDVSLTREPGTGAGKYTITGTSTSKNYIVTVTDGTYTIDKRKVSVTVADKTKTYGDTDPALTLVDSTSMLVNGDKATDLGVTLSRTGDENVGNYVISGTSNSANYDVTVNNGKFDITKRAVTVKAVDNGKTYGGTEPTLTLDDPASVLVNGDTDPIAALAITLKRETGENVGEYAITGSSESKNYAVTVTPAKFTISQQAITLTADSSEITYGDTEPALTWKITSGALTNGDTLAKLNVKTSRDSGDGAGKYTIKLSADNANYNFTFVTGNLTIDKRAITVKASDFSKTYGDADQKLTIETPTLVGTDTEAALGIKLSRKADENVGSYQISGTGTSDNYLVTVTNGTYTINKRQVTVTADSLTKDYGDADPALTLTIPKGTLVNNEVVQDTDASALGVTLSRTDKNENVGTYTITGSSDSQNYAVTVTPGTLTIGQRTIHVQATDEDKTYGDADPALDWTIEPNSDPNKPALASWDTKDSLGVTLVRDTGDGTGESANAYTIHLGADKASLNSNYKIIVDPGTFTIHKRAATITLDSLTKTYGEDDPALTWQLTSGDLPAGKTLADLGIVLTRVAGNDVGTYAITVKSSNSDYDLTVVGHDLTITPRHITVQTDTQTKVYGDADPALTIAAITDPTALGYQDTAADLKLSLSRVTGENVGTYKITGVSGNKNYDVTVTPADFNITKRVVTVQAADQTKTYGESDQALTLVDPTVLKNGDDVSALGVTLTRQSGENAGTYEIDGTANSANYVVAILPATLTIERADAAAGVKDVSTTYGDVPSFTEELSAGNFAGLMQTDFEIYNLQDQLVSANNLSAGQYTVRLSRAGLARLMAVNANYDYSALSGQLSVAKRKLTVQLGDQEMFAGESTPETSATITDGTLPAGETLSDLGLTVDQPNTKTVGDYDLAAIVNNPNYDVDVIPGELKVLGKTVDSDGNTTITEKDKSGQVVNITKEWSDHSETTYTYDPTTSKVTVTEIVDGKVVSKQTANASIGNIILKDGDGAATVIDITNVGGEPKIAHYEADPDHDGVPSDIELEHGTNPLVADNNNDGQAGSNQSDPTVTTPTSTAPVPTSTAVSQPTVVPLVKVDHDRESTIKSGSTTTTSTSQAQAATTSLRAAAKATTKSQATQLPQTNEQSTSFLAALGLLLSSFTLAFFRKRH
ncbi:hypothetical protein [Lactobacillus koreensis] [Lactiplantibacillus mudanjiangensis]|uniref:MBG domain-containing protein n=1 Tax=Lactiplantibacillus mudanjiangensis TaxID=1296538 RepID=UPI001015905C|nr:hypothetical protein [Lactobacillus koreensis] [Lactiplantibacillus mudanjiangensis]